MKADRSNAPPTDRSMQHMEPTANQHWNAWRHAIVTLAGIVFLALCYALPPLLAQRENEVSIADCRRHLLPIEETEGILRLAGPDYYLVSGERWLLLGHLCAGKTRMQCLAANHGAGQFMEEHVGQPAQASACRAGVVDFVIAGRQFFR